MVAILILSGIGALNHSTETIWKKVCEKYRIELATYNLSDDRLPEHIKELKLTSFPSFIMNNKVMAVGHPDDQAAEEIILNLIDKQH